MLDQSISIKDRYPYKPSFFWPLIGIVLFGGCFWLELNKALSNTSELKIIFIKNLLTIHLSVFSATIFHVIMALLGLLLALGGIVALALSFFSTNTILVTDNDIICPHGPLIKRRTIRIPFDHIKSVEITKAYRTYILTIEHLQGKTVLTDYFLRKKHLFEIYDLLEQKVGNLYNNNKTEK